MSTNSQRWLSYICKSTAQTNTCLDKADVIRVLPEALAAHVEPVFTDQTVSVRAYPAEKQMHVLEKHGEDDLIKNVQQVQAHSNVPG